jgi:hypothetical protein
VHIENIILAGILLNSNEEYEEHIFRNIPLKKKGKGGASFLRGGRSLLLGTDHEEESGGVSLYDKKSTKKEESKKYFWPQ